MRRNILWVLAYILSTAMLACGGGGGGSSIGGVVSTADTMTVTISSPSGTVTTTYTEGSYNAQGKLDPELISYYVTASNRTNIELHSGGSNKQGSTILGISVEGDTPQSYPTGVASGTTNYIAYDIYDTHYQSYISSISSGNGTITLSRIGNVGEKITGKFDAELTSINNTSNKINISGTFSVKRDN